MKSDAQIRAERARLANLRQALVGPVYPADSLYAQGFPSRHSEYDPAIAALDWVLEKPSKANALKPRQTANITDQELEDLQGLSKRIEKNKFLKIWVEEGEVNNLYDLGWELPKDGGAK